MFEFVTAIIFATSIVLFGIGLLWFIISEHFELNKELKE